MCVEWMLRSVIINIDINNDLLDPFKYFQYNTDLDDWTIVIDCP